jgi:hypothetical protein
MSKVRFARGYPLAQYRVYSLCCQKLLDFYEELSEVCDIDTLVGMFDVELRDSYCGDNYDLAVENADLFLQRFINRYSLSADARKKLKAIQQGVRDHAGDWDFCPFLIEFSDIGKELAQNFYREGDRAPNIELIDCEAPALVFSNLCLSQTTLSGFTEPRPISTLPDGIHLPFTNEFKFHYYLSYPFLFFHEYASHVYVPRIESRTFDDGWLMYAIELFMKTRWTELSERYPLICAQVNVLKKVWEPRFTRLARKGYYLAENVNMWIGNDRFLHFTWDLASYPNDFAEHFDFHNDFLNRIKQFASRDKGHLLGSAAEISTSALQLYENLKAVS